MKKTVLTFGLISGVIISVLMGGSVERQEGQRKKRKLDI